MHDEKWLAAFCKTRLLEKLLTLGEHDDQVGVEFDEIELRSVFLCIRVTVQVKHRH